MNENTIHFLNLMERRKCQWVTIEILDTGLIQVLNVSDNVHEAFGSALYHIYCCESTPYGSPFITEGEDGIGIPYKYLSDLNNGKEPTDFVYILKYGEERDE